MAGEMTLNSDSQENPEWTATDRHDPDRRGVIRSLTESLVSLFIAVLLFRTFVAEGYMISTGSMAPCLLGFHKRVECPKCHLDRLKRLPLRGFWRSVRSVEAYQCIDCGNHFIQIHTH